MMMTTPFDGVIFLVGARASGKTSLGKLLAAALGTSCLDTDLLLVAALGRSIADVVRSEGWEAFRRHESTVLREAIARAAQGGVISTGGGMVLAPENRALMRGTGIVFYLHAPASVLAERLLAQPLEGQRPSLTGQGIAEETARILAERDGLYREVASCVLEAAQPLQTVLEQALAYLRGQVRK